MPCDLLYHGNAINRAHPLMRRVISRYRVTPWYNSGPRWIDLAGKQPGTRNSTGVTWAEARGRPGGDGAISFGGGASDHVDVTGLVGGTLTGTVFSFAVWFRPTGGLTSYGAIVDAFSSPNRQFSAFTGNVASHLFIGFANVAAGTEVTLSASWVLNVWQQLAITCDGTTITIYRNGVSVGSALGSTGPCLGTGFLASTLQFGGNSSGGGAAYPGQQDDAIIWDRCLSASEVRQLYDATSRRGDPTLSWIAEEDSFAPTPAAGGPVAKLVEISQAVKLGSTW